MTKSRDLTGVRFGHLTGKSFSHIDTHGKHFWNWVCDCGKEHLASKAAVARGNTKSCGCQRWTGNHRTHGLTGTPEELIWANIRRRCEDPSNPTYHHYGGRGIKNLYANVGELVADIGRRPSKHHSVDRIDNDGPYGAGNCRWATKAEQACNTRANVWIKAHGKVQTIAQWSRETGLLPSGIRYRMKRGFTPEEIVDPVHRNRWKHK